MLHLGDYDKTINFVFYITKGLTLIFSLHAKGCLFFVLLNDAKSEYWAWFYFPIYCI